MTNILYSLFPLKSHIKSKGPGFVILYHLDLYYGMSGNNTVNTFDTPKKLSLPCLFMKDNTIKRLSFFFFTPLMSMKVKGTVGSSLVGSFEDGETFTLFLELFVGKGFVYHRIRTVHLSH